MSIASRRQSEILKGVGGSLITAVSAPEQRRANGMLLGSTSQCFIEATKVLYQPFYTPTSSLCYLRLTHCNSKKKEKKTPMQNFLLLVGKHSFEHCLKPVHFFSAKTIHNILELCQNQSETQINV